MFETFRLSISYDDQHALKEHHKYPFTEEFNKMYNTKPFGFRRDQI